MIEKPNGVIWISSFDIGFKNFSFCIEQYDTSQINGICNVQEKIRYLSNGQPTDKFSSVLDSLYKCGKVILFKNANICTEKTFDYHVFSNMYEHLNTYKEYWDKCDSFIIEQQMSFGKNQNVKACKLGQHCYSYFVFCYRTSKRIVEFPAYHKTRVLGAPMLETKTKTGLVKYKATDKPTRKKWAVQKAKEILELRNDIENLKLYEDKPRKKGVVKIKLDDISDCMLHNIAFMYLAYVDKSI
jgi:hypothetical protein